MNDSDSNIAVLIPCRNEELTVTKVVSGFRDALPQAAIYVYDNAGNAREWIDPDIIIEDGKTLISTLDSNLFTGYGTLGDKLENYKGVLLTSHGFSEGILFGKEMVTLAVVLFALSTGKINDSAQVPLSCFNLIKALKTNALFNKQALNNELYSATEVKLALLSSLIAE